MLVSNDYRRCVLDGEIVCLDSDGKPQFRDLPFRRVEPFFYAFDILWDEHARSDDKQEMRRFRNGEDIRYLPLTDANFGSAGLCRREVNAFCTVTTSRLMESNCSCFIVEVREMSPGVQIGYPQLCSRILIHSMLRPVSCATLPPF